MPRLIRSHLKVLSRRARYINFAITACTVTALLVCAVIAILFFGSYIDFDSRTAVSLIFIIAMLTLMIGLLCFLQEVFLATLNLRIGPNSSRKGCFFALRRQSSVLLCGVIGRAIPDFLAKTKIPAFSNGN